MHPVIECVIEKATDPPGVRPKLIQAATFCLRKNGFETIAFHLLRRVPGFYIIAPLSWKTDISFVRIQLRHQQMPGSALWGRLRCKWQIADLCGKSFGF
ncbi:hypothetical protein TcasGA2_TC000718 [Tribolium castaneum]|uniref:Uncharacterized protein n=1 Tax=Tribolium castaneum TaxID=7070 RepID=D6W8R6_TRICA|nr:hypothetical protein TcasGA2_TC000718 [Tribolium castaneum]